MRSWRSRAAHSWEAVRLVSEFLELGHDVTGNQLIAVADLLAVGPLGGHDEQAAEAAAGLVQPVDGGHQVVGRAHAPGAAVDHGVDELLGRAVEGLFKPHGVFKVVGAGSGRRRRGPVRSLPGGTRRYARG